MIHLRLLKNSHLFALHRNKSVFSCKSSLRRVFGHIPHPTPESDKFEFEGDAKRQDLLRKGPDTSKPF